MWLRKNHTRVNFSTQAAGEKRGFCATKYGSTPPPPPPAPVLPHVGRRTPPQPGYTSNKSSVMSQKESY